MKSWLFSVVVLFVLAKAFLWIKGFILPVPIYILAGAFLAIASNYDKGMQSLFRPETRENKVITQTASLVEEVALLESDKKAE